MFAGFFNEPQGLRLVVGVVQYDHLPRHLIVLEAHIASSDGFDKLILSHFWERFNIAPVAGDSLLFSDFLFLFFGQILLIEIVLTHSRRHRSGLLLEWGIFYKGWLDGQGHQRPSQDAHVAEDNRAVRARGLAPDRVDDWFYHPDFSEQLIVGDIHCA